MIPAITYNLVADFLLLDMSNYALWLDLINGLGHRPTHLELTPKNEGQGQLFLSPTHPDPQIEVTRL